MARKIGKAPQIEKAAEGCSCATCRYVRRTERLLSCGDMNTYLQCSKREIKQRGRLGYELIMQPVTCRMLCDWFERFCY